MSADATHMGIAEDGASLALGRFGDGVAGFGVRRGDAQAQKEVSLYALEPVQKDRSFERTQVRRLVLSGEGRAADPPSPLLGLGPSSESTVELVVVGGKGDKDRR